ncbi:hypothetical protein C8Q78DRAFT_1040795 [Trametes maxima]|nr:hypothetical protein C8Q78DRAFT_1040795 [Trametes maxima]
MHSKNCPRCKTPNYTPYGTQPGATHYLAGDICAIYERASTPVYLYLNNRPPTSGILRANQTWGSITYNASGWRKSGSAVNNVGESRSTGVERDNPHRPRPCVLMDTTLISSSPLNVRVCLFATFDGEWRPSALPRVLQHFCIPIFPHICIVPGKGENHAHTTPEWEHADAWLLAMPFNSTAGIEGRWVDERPHCVEGDSLHFARSDMIALAKVCENKRRQWEMLCLQDKKLRTRSLKEYQVNPQTARFMEVT